MLSTCWLSASPVESIRSDIVGKLEAEREGLLKIIRAEQEARQSQAVAERPRGFRRRLPSKPRVSRGSKSRRWCWLRSPATRRSRMSASKRLSGIVATMKPKAAAAMLAGMDETVALRVLLNLTPKSAGRVLAPCPPGSPSVSATA